jgi:hypothetical protein
VSQSISPPVERGAADAEAFEVAGNVNLYLDGIAAGGQPHPASWDHDGGDFAVAYAGSANPYWADDAPVGVCYEATDDGTLRREQVTLDADDDPFASGSEGNEVATEETDDTAMGNSTETAGDARPSRRHPEITRLRDFLGVYRQHPLDDADTETLVDLYALLSVARSRLESRRKELRDSLTERTDADQTLDGTLGSVEHRTYTTRSARDADAVRDALADAGIDPDRVVETVERVDEDELDAVIEEVDGGETDLDETDVYDTDERRQIRRGDTEFDV